MFCLGLTLTPVKSLVENERCIKQVDCQCKMANTGFHSVVANRAQMCTADHGIGTTLFKPWIATKKIIVLRIARVKSLNLRADCQEVIPVVTNRGTLESHLPRGYSRCGEPRY
jgi:hypothetical protein